MSQKPKSVGSQVAIVGLRASAPARGFHALSLFALGAGAAFAVACAPSATVGTATAPTSHPTDTAPRAPESPTVTPPSLAGCGRKVGASVHGILMDESPRISILVLVSTKPNPDEFPELTFGPAQLGASGFQAYGSVPKALIPKICAHPNLTWLDASSSQFHAPT